jgi:hypothetical protein
MFSLTSLAMIKIIGVMGVANTSSGVSARLA